MSGGLAPAIGQDLLERIEAHAVQAWPPATVEVSDDGWVLRATPGLGRGRSNHALTPPRAGCQDVDDAAVDIDEALARVFEFADRHGIQPGIQASPLHHQGGFVQELSVRGWEIGPTVLVMSRDREPLEAQFRGLDLVVEDHATPDWLAAWSLCEPEREDIQAHVDTVFRGLRRRARFARHDDRAVGISIESDGLACLCCIAVAPESRRTGLGTAFVGELIGSSGAELTYLQTFESNFAARALYDRLGFREAYRYCHCVLPD